MSPRKLSYVTEGAKARSYRFQSRRLQQQKKGPVRNTIGRLARRMTRSFKGSDAQGLLSGLDHRFVKWMEGGRLHIFSNSPIQDEVHPFVVQMRENNYVPTTMAIQVGALGMVAGLGVVLEIPVHVLLGLAGALGCTAWGVARRVLGVADAHRPNRLMRMLNVDVRDDAISSADLAHNKNFNYVMDLCAMHSDVAQNLAESFRKQALPVVHDGLKPNVVPYPNEATVAAVVFLEDLINPSYQLDYVFEDPENVRLLLTVVFCSSNRFLIKKNWELFAHFLRRRVRWGEPEVHELFDSLFEVEKFPWSADFIHEPAFDFILECMFSHYDTLDRDVQNWYRRRAREIDCKIIDLVSKSPHVIYKTNPTLARIMKAR